jgi:hypothetical protein
MRTNFNIYVFILTMLFVNYNVRVNGRLLSPDTQNFIIKFNEILSMDDISYEILSHGHYFIEDNIL